MSWWRPLSSGGSLYVLELDGSPPGELVTKAKSKFYEIQNSGVDEIDLTEQEIDEISRQKRSETYIGSA